MGVGVWGDLGKVRRGLATQHVPERARAGRSLVPHRLVSVSPRLDGGLKATGHHASSSGRKTEEAPPKLPSIIGGFRDDQIRCL